MKGSSIPGGEEETRVLLLIFGWHEGGNEVLRVLRVFQPLDRGTHGREALTSLDDPSHVR